mgnify:CR=1 FL=1
MKTKVRLISLILILSLLAGTVIGCGKTSTVESPAKEGETTETTLTEWGGAKLTLGTLNPDNNSDSLAAKWFADQLYKKTNGKLVVDFFPGSQLGNQTAQIESLVMGTQDIFIGGIEPFSSIAQELNVLNVFFLFQSQEQFQKFFSSEWFDSAQEKLASKNIVCINEAMNWVKGPFRIILSTKEIDGSLSSFKGMKIRIPDQEVFKKSFDALGLVPVVVALNETYLALQQGLVEAVDLIPASIKTNGFQEIVKYILKTDAFPQREGVMMSKSALESLPKEIQQLVYETADEAGEYYSKLVMESSDSVLKEVKEMGIVYIDDANLSEWYDSCKDLGYELENSGYLPKGITDDIKAMK